MNPQDVRLSREQAEQWTTFGPEWSGFRDAWLGKGLQWPPRGTDDDHRTLRGVLYPAIRHRPDDIGTWVTEAPTRDPYTITAYVLGRWEAVDRSPLTTTEAKHALTSILDIINARGTIDPRSGEAAPSDDGLDASGLGTVPPMSQRLPSRPSGTPDYERLREVFLRLLTVDSETHDRRRRDFNQAIFNRLEGWAVFNGTDLDMVMQKFDKAVKEVTR